MNTYVEELFVLEHVHNSAKQQHTVLDARYKKAD